MAVQFTRRPFSVDEYYRMAQVGILGEDDRVELIEGEIIEMSPIGSRHAACVKRLTALLGRRLGEGAILSVQDPVRLGDYSEPQPDVALLRPRADFYAGGHPAPEDVWLVIEVADTSAIIDRNLKPPLYARAGVIEVWIIDLSQDLIEVHTQPSGGAYQVVRQVRRGESLAPGQLPALGVSAEAVLG